MYYALISFNTESVHIWGIVCLTVLIIDSFSFKPLNITYLKTFTQYIKYLSYINAT